MSSVNYTSWNGKYNSYTFYGRIFIRFLSILWKFQILMDASAHLCTYSVFLFHRYQVLDFYVSQRSLKTTEVIDSRNICRVWYQNIPSLHRICPTPTRNFPFALNFNDGRWQARNGGSRQWNEKNSKVNRELKTAFVEILTSGRLNFSKFVRRRFQYDFSGECKA